MVFFPRFFRAPTRLNTDVRVQFTARSPLGRTFVVFPAPQRSLLSSTLPRGILTHAKTALLGLEPERSSPPDMTKVKIVGRGDFCDIHRAVTRLRPEDPVSAVYSSAGATVLKHSSGAISQILSTGEAWRPFLEIDGQDGGVSYVNGKSAFTKASPFSQKLTVVSLDEKAWAGAWTDAWYELTARTVRAENWTSSQPVEIGFFEPILRSGPSRAQIRIPRTLNAPGLHQSRFLILFVARETDT